MGPDLPEDYIPQQGYQEYSGKRSHSMSQKFSGSFPLQVMADGGKGCHGAC